MDLQILRTAHMPARINQLLVFAVPYGELRWTIETYTEENT